jgi:hypothetical protein
MKKLALAVVALSVTLIFSSRLVAQTASVNGTVTDPTGALVQHAKVTVRNTATNAVREADTGTVGVYDVTHLPAGPYEVTIEKSGFKPVKYEAVTLTVDQALTLNAKFEVGSTKEQVTVEGGKVVPIDTTDAQVSNVVDEKQMQALPLILRDPYQLVLLSPGTTYTNDGLGDFSIDGGRDRNNNFQLDGTNNNDPGVPGSGLLTLNPDATQEFRVITNNYLPEFGRNSFGVVDIISRSGTNNLHGDLYYFGRWNALGARDYFNPEATTGRQSPYVRNIFGGSVGGPVIKNKLFFFFNYEAQRFATATTTMATVPTAAFKTGVFTYTDPQSGPININVSTPGSANNAFALALDPQIQKILGFYPAAPPNSQPVIPGISDSFFFADTDLSNTNNYVAKVDYTINAKNNLSVRYIANQATDNGASGNVLPGIGGAAFRALGQSLNGHLTTTLSATRQNDFYASANRVFSSFTSVGFNTIDNLSLAGLDPFGRGRDWILPAFTQVSCYQLGDSDGQDRPFGTYDSGDNFTWIKGRHSMKFGFDFVDNYTNDFDNFSTRSTPNFAIFGNALLSPLDTTTSAEITNPTVFDAVWGLLGGVYNESQTQLFNFAGARTPSDERGFRERDIYGFAQDQFKLTSNFTFNYGLRYEWDGVPWVVQNQLTSATPAALSGPPPITFVRVTRGGSNPLYVNDVKGFEPRFGFAWDPFRKGKTSIRGGYGIFRDREYFNLTGDTRANPPFSLPYVNNVYNTVGLEQISDIPIPATQPAPGPTLPQFSFAFPATINPNFHVPYVQQWNLGIQHALGAHLNLEINYVGNKANRLLRVVDGNPPIPSLVAQLRTFCADPTFAQRFQANPSDPGPNPANAYGCSDGPNIPPFFETVAGGNLYVGAQAAGLYSGITGLPALPSDAVNNAAAYHSNEVSSVANSNYNGLQATLNHPLSHGVSFQINYTWSHAIDDASDAFHPQLDQFVFPCNSFELRREKGNSSFDVRHRLVANYIAELPFGRGKSHLNTGFAGRVLEGWNWSGIVTLQTGFPEDIFASGVDSDGTGALQRASYASSPTSATFTPGYFPHTGPNPDLFAFPLFGGPGSVHRNTFYGPGYKNFDMVVAKTTKFTERMSLEFRSEYYNILNHPNFGPPDNFINDIGGTFSESTSEVGRNDGTTGARQLQFAMKLHF